MDCWVFGACDDSKGVGENGLRVMYLHFGNTLSNRKFQSIHTTRNALNLKECF